MNVARRNPSAAAALTVACLLLAFAVAATTSAASKSSTWDETHYFGLGAYLLETGRWDVHGSILHPPLSYYLHSIPLLFSDLPNDAFRGGAEPLLTREALGRAHVGRGRRLLSSPANADDALLGRARFMMILVGVVGGLFVALWSHALYGPRAAVIAAVLYAFSPNLLAHTRLITPDIALTAFFTGAVFGLWKAVTSGRTTFWLLTGGCFGLALLCKYSALLLLPLGAILAAVSARAGRPGRPGQWLGLLAVAGFVVLLAYRFDPTPYWEGVWYQLDHFAGGHRAFLLGSVSSSGWWYFPLVALALKLPLAAMLLVGLAGVLLARDGRDARRLDTAFVLLPPLAFIAFFTAMHQSIGLRYLLPALPFLFVFASRVASVDAFSRPARAGIAALLLWYAGASVWIHPHYLAYFNELAGGPGQGYRRLVDSNLDWGQDLKGLARFARERGIGTIHLSYFGTDTPERYGLAYRWLPSYVLRNPDPEGGFPRRPRGWIAISATNLQGVYLRDPDLFAYLAEEEPVAVIGYSIFVYRRP